MRGRESRTGWNTTLCLALGAVVLTAFTFVQHLIVGAPVLAVASYIWPALFGGTLGLLVALWAHRLAGTGRVHSRTHPEERGEQLFEAAPDGMCILDTDGRIVDCNAAEADLLGYTREELIGKHALDFMDALSKDRFYEHFESLRGLTPAEGDLHLQKKDGTIVEVWHKDVPRADAHGEFAGVLRFDRVVTEQRQAQRRLHAQRNLALALGAVSYIDEALNRCIASALQVTGVDSGGVYLLNDQGGLDLTAHKGLSPEFVAATSHYGPEAPQVRLVMKGKPVYDPYRQTGQGHDTTWEGEGLRTTGVMPITHKGKCIGCLNVASHTLDGIPESSRVALEAIAAQMGSAIARIQAERDCRESEKSYRRLIKTMNEGLQIADANGVLTYVNRAFAALIGESPEDIAGRSLWDFVSEENKNALDRQWAERRAGKQEPYELELVDAAGAKHEVLVSPNAMFDDENRFLGSVAVITDLAELKRLQDRVARAERMESLGRLAGGVAHDLNNILSGLVSYPDLLLTDLPEDSPLYRPLLTIKKSGERAAGIVEDLLTLTRRGVPLREVVALDRIIEDYLGSPEFDRLKADHAAVEVVCELEPGLLHVRGSGTQLRQTIVNLVSNAMEAMPDGGLLTLTAANRYVDEPIPGYDTVTEGEYVVLRVSDTGVGLSPEDREHIFEPFYTKKVMGRSGTGLGLTVVWGAVCDHQGYVDVASSEGQGTTLSLYFPATRDAIEAAGSQGIEAFKGSGETVLVVDDIEEQREIASRMLTTLGYSVDAVSSGDQALEYVKEHRVDLMILDMVMGPGMDGLDTYRKAIEISPRQRAIIASGYSETERVREAQRLGAGAYLKKPYGLDELARTVKAGLTK